MLGAAYRIDNAPHVASAISCGNSLLLSSIRAAGSRTTTYRPGGTFPVFGGPTRPSPCAAEKWPPGGNMTNGGSFFQLLVQVAPIPSGVVRLGAKESPAQGRLSVGNRICPCIFQL